MAMPEVRTQQAARIVPGFSAAAVGGVLGLVGLKTSGAIVLLVSLAIAAAVMAILQQTLA